MAVAEPLTPQSLDIISNEHYVNGYPHEEWARLRREAPVFYYDQHVINPFWAVTRHADIVKISREPSLFRNGPRIAVLPGFDLPEDAALQIRHLLNMDPPEHGAFRKLTSARFTPRGLLPFAHDVARISDALLDEMYQGGEEVETDFVEAFSARLPLEVLAAMLGVPTADWSLMFKWTNEIVGSSDPEYREEGETRTDTTDRARNALFGYFMAMVEERRAKPTGDIVSLIANSELGGERIPPVELLSYYFLLVVAGNETTRNATSGGLAALIENPGELAKLRADESLMKPAVEEIVRWTSPVIQFCRTPLEDIELRGQKIRAGENLCLFYPSANRDEEVFEAPDEFRVDRRPNHHLGFGIGEHFCLGANLARLELRVAFTKLLRRLESVEAAGEIDRLASSFIGGIKRMPIRYRLNSGADA